MGMSASQARLLSLTARLHDVELKAQNIMSQKIALATQEDELYQEYCAALDATNIKVAMFDQAGNRSYVDANYTSLCGYNPDRRVKYALRDNNSGNLIVTEDIKEAYDTYGNDKYAFAYAMMGFDGCFAWNDNREAMFIGYGLSQANSGDANGIVQYIEEDDGSVSIYMTECEQIVYNANQNDTDLTDKYEAILNAEGADKKREALAEFRDYLYKNYDEEIYAQMNLDKQTDPDDAEPVDDREWSELKGEFQHYVDLWSAINDAGGCQVIDPMYENGEDGNKWFQNMVESGVVSILAFNVTGHRNEWSETSVATSTNNNYLQEMKDEDAIKKAEIEYEHELSIINRKDTKFDNELNKLETERSAITTEMESIEKVRDDNIDRTFGIFS